MFFFLNTFRFGEIQNCKCWGKSCEFESFSSRRLDIGLFCIEDVFVYGEESQEGEKQSNRGEEMPHVMVVVKGREAARYNLIIVLNVTEMKWKELLKQKSYHYIISFWDVSVLIWWMSLSGSGNVRRFVL